MNVSLSSSPPESTVSLPATRPIAQHPAAQERFTTRALFCRQARVGLGHLLDQLSWTTGQSVLLPPYIGYSPREGSGIMDPISARRLPTRFYRLDPHLRIDLQDFQQQLRAQPIGLVLVVHYFGFPQPELPAVARLCREAGVVLVEDCCHCLPRLDEAPAPGSWGDFALYSVPKWLPVREGGILRIHPDRPSPAPLAEGDEMSRDTLCVLPQTRWEEITRQRRSNYQQLAEQLGDQDGLTVMYPQLPPGVTPLNFPLLLRSADRHTVFQHLLQENIRATALYYQLADQVPLDRYPECASVSKQILNLPIHQTVSAADVLAIARAVRDAL